MIKIAEALIENETLTAEQIDKIIKGEPFLDLPAAPEVKSKSEETVETETIVTEITENSQTETEAE